MNNQKGFIQIPILIAIIAGILVVGVGYVGISQYKNSKSQKDEISLGQTNAEQQNNKVDALNKEIETLKQQINATSSQIKTVERIIEKVIEKPSTQIQSTPNPVTPTAGVAQNKNEESCNKFRGEYSNFVKKENDIYNLRLDVDGYFGNLVTTPSGMTGSDYFAFLNNKLTGGKDTLLKKIDKLDSSIDLLPAISSFVTSIPENTKTLYQQSANSERELLDAWLLFTKTTANISPFSTQWDAALATLKEAQAKGRDNNTKTSSNIETNRNNLYQEFKNAHPKLGCTWIIPGTTTAPGVSFSIIGSGYLGGQYNSDARSLVAWSSTYADSCIGTSDTPAANKRWEGIKKFSSTEDEVFYKLDSGPAKFTLSCSNYYGTTKKTVTFSP